MVSGRPSNYKLVIFILILLLPITVVADITIHSIIYSGYGSICDPEEAVWADEFTNRNSRWDWNYNEGTAYKQLTTIDGFSVVEIGITSQSSSSSYSDCSLHERSYYIYNGVFEARVRYVGDHQFGTLGWGVWNYENPQDAEAAWFWDSSTGGIASGFQAMVAYNGAIQFQEYLPDIDIEQWHVYRVELSPTGTRFFVDDNEVASTSRRPSKPQRFEIWVDNYRIEIVGGNLQPVGYLDLQGNHKIYIDWARYYEECVEVEEDTTPPATITDLTATTGADFGEVDLTWTAPGDDGDIGTASQYIIKYSTSAITEANWSSAIDTSGEPTPQPAGTSQSFTVTGLTGGETYYFAIKARDNADNISDISNSPSAVAKEEDTTPPSIPVSLSAVANGQEIELSWTSSTDPESGVSGYKLYRGTSSSGESFYRDLGNVTSYQDTETLPDTTYYYKVSAVNGAGLESGLSNEAQATTEDEPPSAPQNLAAIPGDNLVNLSWDNNPESDIDYHNIYKDTVSGFTPTSPVATSDTNSYIDTAVSNGITYYYRVSAVDVGNNEGAYSQEVSVTPSEEPNLIAYWKFDEGSGTQVTDSSGNGNDGIIYGATRVSEGKFGSCLSFDGSSDYIAIPSHTTLRPANITINVWVKPDSATIDEYASIVGHPYDDEASWDHPYFSWRIGRWSNTSNVQYFISDSGGLEDSQGSADVWNRNEWQMVTLVYDGETTYGYVNGEPDGTDTTPGGNIDYDASNPDVVIGMRSVDDTGEYYGGLIDEIRIYNRALTPEEILAHYQIGLDETPPAAITDLSAQTGTNPGEVDLTWTATGDDGNTGTAAKYIIKYSQSYITESNWDSATAVSNPPSPRLAGTQESFTVSGLTPGQTYYFAIKIQDEVPNTSYISNSPDAIAKEEDEVPPGKAGKPVHVDA